MSDCLFSIVSYCAASGEQCCNVICSVFYLYPPVFLIYRVKGLDSSVFSARRYKLPIAQSLSRNPLFLLHLPSPNRPPPPLLFLDPEQKATLRVTNLSEDATEGDLQDLFRPYGQIARVAVPKDRVTGQPRGFAFVDFYHTSDAQRAIDKVHGTGFNSLILSVEWAR